MALGESQYPNLIILKNRSNKPEKAIIGYNKTMKPLEITC
jgi:hypothetical protein